MIAAVQNNLKILASRLGTEIISGETFSNIATLAQSFPFLNNALLECRLAANQPQVDLSTMILSPNINLPNHLLTHPVWQRFQNMCQEWATPSSFLNQRLREIGLEFDVDGTPSNVPIPGIFLVLNLAFNWNTQLLLQMAKKLLGEAEVTPQLAKSIQGCFEALPDGANIIYVAAMLSRRTDVLRLNVSGLPLNQITNYLVTVGWAGTVSELNEIISVISPFTDTIVLSFDISNGLHPTVNNRIFPRIGLECYLLDPPQQEKRWELFYNYLIVQGLCSPNKSEIILGWPEFTLQNTSAHFSVCTKIVYQPGSPLEAKAYLGFWPS
jgi:hypothetical protein